MSAAKTSKMEKPVASFSDQDGGVYLLVADESAEFEAALRRVAFLAQQNNGHAAILYVIEDDSFMHWSFIEKQIASDKRQEAEKVLWDIAQRLYDMAGIMPAFYIREGKRREQITQILNEDKTLRALVLGANSSMPNPLISYFSGKGLSNLRVPLVIVPEDV